MQDISREFLRRCDGIARAVSDVITPLVGKPEAGRVTGMGADGTPTKLIDQLAEALVDVWERLELPKRDQAMAAE